MQNNSFLGTEKIGELLRKFAIPCIASLLISALYNIVDQIFIGMVVATTMIVIFMRRLRSAPAPAVAHANATITSSHPGPIITIAREHGSAGKAISQLVAKELGIPCYYKELTAIIAKESGMAADFIDKLDHKDEQKSMYELYLSSIPSQYAIEAQNRVLREIAKRGSSVIIGRASDWVLKDNPDVIRVFIFAPEKYRIKKLKEMYGDSPKKAVDSIKRSDENRAAFYKAISGEDWGQRENYDLIIDSSIGNEATAKIIADFAKAKQN